MMQIIIVWRGLSVCGRGRRGTGLLVTSSLDGWARTQSDPWFAVACPDGMGHAWGPVGPRWAPCWPHEICYQGKASTVGLLLVLLFMYLDHLLTNSIMITCASVTNETIVHMSIERYILNYLSITLSGHPFYYHYYYYHHHHYYYFHYYYYYFFILFFLYLNVIRIQIEIDYYS